MNKTMLWIPRIFTIAFILFLGIFALDAFGGDQSLARKTGAFLIHLIPNFILLTILILAWKREWIGTIAYFITGIFYIVMFWGRFPFATYLIIAGPLFIISLLFWINWTNRKKLKQIDLQ